MVVFANGIWKSGTNLLLRGLDLIGARQGRLSIGSFSRETLWSAVCAAATTPPPKRIHSSRVNVGLEIDAYVSPQWLHGCIQRRIRDTNCEVFGGHVGYSWPLAKALGKEDCRSVIVVREPAAVLASFCKWVRKNDHFFLYRHFAGLDDAQIAELLLTGFPTPRGHFLPFRIVHTRMLGWQDEPQALVLRFEDIVGPKGGGTKDAQRRAFESLAKFLGRAEPDWDAIDGKLFGHGVTFERGSIDGWQSELDPKLIDRVHAATATFRSCYGYR